MNVLKHIDLAIKDAEYGIDGISAILLLGEPGVGKTFLGEAVVEIWEAKRKIFFQLYEGVEKEKLLMDISVPRLVKAMVGKDASDQSISDIIQDGVLYQFVRSTQKTKTVLILDELDKADEEVDILMLDLLQNGRISDPSFGEVFANSRNGIIVMTSNEERKLNKALYRRIRKVRMIYPDPKQQFDLLNFKAEKEIIAIGEKKVNHLIKISEAYRLLKPEIKTNPYVLYRIIMDLYTMQHSEKEDIVDLIRDWFSSETHDWKLIDEKLKVDSKSFKDYVIANF